MVVYSFSQINLYNQCPKKYQFRYLDGLEREFETSPDLILWTSVHWALEWLYQQVSILNTPIKADVLWKFHQLWNDSIAEAGEKLIYKWDQHEDDYLRRWEKYLESYYDKYSPFKDTTVIATESMMNFSLDKDTGSESKQFRWIIDRLDKDSEWNFIINDYKTNKKLPPEGDDEYREQLTLYAYWVQQKYGKYLKNIKARILYLHFDITDEWEISQESIDNIVLKYTSAINKIENSRFDYNMWVKDAFPTNQNSYCKYCEYQNVCPLWQHLSIEDEIINGGDLWETTIKKLIDQYAEYAQKATEATKEKDAIKDIIVDYAEKKWLEQLFWEKYKISVSKTYNYSAKDLNALKDFLKEKNLIDEASDIPYYKINALVKNEKLSSQEIQTYLDKKDSWRLSPWKKD